MRLKNRILAALIVGCALATTAAASAAEFDMKLLNKGSAGGMMNSRSALADCSRSSSRVACVGADDRWC